MWKETGGGVRLGYLKKNYSPEMIKAPKMIKGIDGTRLAGLGRERGTKESSMILKILNLVGRLMKTWVKAAKSGLEIGWED